MRTLILSIGAAGRPEPVEVARTLRPPAVTRGPSRSLSRHGGSTERTRPRARNRPTGCALLRPPDRGGVRGPGAPLRAPPQPLPPRGARRAGGRAVPVAPGHRPRGERIHAERQRRPQALAAALPVRRRARYVGAAARRRGGRPARGASGAGAGAARARPGRRGGRVALPGALARKLPGGAGGQWLLPATSRYLDPVTGERRRPGGVPHPHETAAQAGVPKRVTCHTFRHRFATRCQGAGYDIRTVRVRRVRDGVALAPGAAAGMSRPIRGLPAALAARVRAV